MKYKKAFCLALVFAFTGCATIPSGPNVRVMPAPGKPFDQFQADNALCMDFARAQIGKDPNTATGEQALSGAIIGGAMGAAAGALLGGSGHAAATGAGVGALFGTAVGAGGASETHLTLQHRYDIAYQQCMYSKGNQVPGYSAQSYSPPPPPSSHTPPPPPPGLPPPPPPQ